MDTIRTSITKDGHVTERSGTGAITLTSTRSGTGAHIQIEVACTKEEAIQGIGELLATLKILHGADFVDQCLRCYAKEVVPMEDRARWIEDRKKYG